MSGSKKTVVLLTPGFPKDEEDTTCLPFLQDYILAFIKLYPDVNLRVLSFQYPHKKGHYKWHGVQVYCAGGESKKGLPRFFVWLFIWKQLKNIYKSEGISVIHSFWLTECCLIAQRFAKRFKLKHVTYAIGQDVLKKNRYLPLLHFDKMHTIAMSQAIAERFRALAGKEVQGIIASGVDRNKINLPVGEKTIDVIGIGALIPLKNYALFIDIIQTLKGKFPKIKACIAGKGEQGQLLKEKVIASGQSNNIEFAGEISHSEVFSYLSKSKVFLHTSSYEGQSTVIMEALAMGLPVVCFDVGRSEMDGNVIVCKDKEEMVEEIEKLLSSEITHKPSTIRTADDMARDFMKVYEL